MRHRLPVDESSRKDRGLLLLLGIVVAGSSWQIASRTGQAEPAGRWRDKLAPVVSGKPTAVRPATPVDFASRLGLARPGTESRRPAGAWMQKPQRTMSRAAFGSPSFSAPGLSQPAQVPEPIARRSTPRQSTSEATRSRQATSAYERNEPESSSVSFGTHSGDPLNPVERSDDPRPEPAAEKAGDEGADGIGRAVVGPGDDSDEDESGEFDPDDEDEEDTLDEADLPTHDDAYGSGMQMLLLGPAVTPRGEIVTYTISVENAEDVAHAPVRLVYDPDVLELVSVEEGSFLRADGATTRFLAHEGNAAGLLEISISRMPPAKGVDGSGVLCRITFLAKSAGSSAVVLAGSRLLDPAGQRLEFTRSDAEIAVK